MYIIMWIDSQTNDANMFQVIYIYESICANTIMCTYDTLSTRHPLHTM